MAWKEFSKDKEPKEPQETSSILTTINWIAVIILISIMWTILFTPSNNTSKTTPPNKQPNTDYQLKL